MLPIKPLEVLALCPKGLAALCRHSVNDAIFIDAVQWSLHLYPEQLAGCTPYENTGVYYYIEWPSDEMMGTTIPKLIEDMIANTDPALWISRAETYVSIRNILNSGIVTNEHIDALDVFLKGTLS